MTPSSDPHVLSWPGNRYRFCGVLKPIKMWKVLFKKKQYKIRDTFDYREGGVIHICTRYTIVLQLYTPKSCV